MKTCAWCHSELESSSGPRAYYKMLTDFGPLKKDKEYCPLCIKQMGGISHAKRIPNDNYSPDIGDY